MAISTYIARKNLASICRCGAVVLCFIAPSHAYALLDSFTDEKKAYTLTITSNKTDESFTEFLTTIQDALTTQAASDISQNYLRYRFEQDREFIHNMLQTRGYYDAVVTGDLSLTELKAVFTVQPGVQYAFGAVTMQMNSKVNNIITPPDKALLKAKTKEPALTKLVAADQEALKAWLEDKHCLFSYKVKHEAILNTTEHTVDISYHIETGKNAVVGPISYSGSNNIAEDYLQQSTPLKQGDCFKRSKLNAAKVKLQKSSLLASAKAVIPEAPQADGSVPVVFELKESKHRSIKTGLNYSTDIGPGFTAGWEHRNIFSRAEKLSTELSVTPIEQKLSTTLDKPHFLRDDQSLKLNATIEQEDSDAFRTSGFTLGGSIDRSLGNGWNAGIGASYGFERIKDQNSTEDVALLTFPIYAAQDKRDDTLNPTKGWTFRANTAPAIDTIGGGTSYVKSSVNGSYYRALPVGMQHKPVLALRAASGAITGASTDDIPATKRFYAGGGWFCPWIWLSASGAIRCTE